MTAPDCVCGHALQLHVPRSGSCTTAHGGCGCYGYTPRTRLADEVPGIEPLPDDHAERAVAVLEAILSLRQAPVDLAGEWAVGWNAALAAVRSLANHAAWNPSESGGEPLTLGQILEIAHDMARRAMTPVGGVNATPDTSAMDGHDDQGGAPTFAPAGPSPSSAADGPYLAAVRLAWPDDDAVRSDPDLAWSQIHELADHLAAALTPSASAPDIWAELAAERARAHGKHGLTSMESADVADPDGTRRDILTEELGEVAREYNDARHEHRPVDLLRVRRELVQLGAMAAAWADVIRPINGPKLGLRRLCPGCHHVWALHRPRLGCTTVVTVGHDVCPCAEPPPARAS